VKDDRVVKRPSYCHVRIGLLHSTITLLECPTAPGIEDSEKIGKLEKLEQGTEDCAPKQPLFIQSDAHHNIAPCCKNKREGRPVSELKIISQSIIAQLPSHLMHPTMSISSPYTHNIPPSPNPHHPRPHPSTRHTPQKERNKVDTHSKCASCSA
jgi:hypothetical protein